MSVIDTVLALLAKLQPPTPPVSSCTRPDGDGWIVPIQTADGEYALQHLPAARVPRTIVELHALPDLTSWVASWPTPRRALVSVGETEITIQLLEGEGAAPFEKGVVTRLQTPTAAAWLRSLDKYLDQAELFRLVRLHGEALGEAHGPDGKSLGPASEHLLRQLQQVSLATKGEHKVELGAHGEVRVVGDQARREVSAVMPGSFILELRPWIGLDQLVRVKVYVELDTEKGFRVVLRAPLVWEDLVYARLALVHELRAQLPPNVAVVTGRSEQTTAPGRFGS